MERSEIRELSSATESRIVAALHPGYTARRASSPRVSSGPRARRSFLFLLPRRGVRNDRAFHRARGARMCWMRASRMPFARHTGSGPAHRRRAYELNRASEAALRLRSAREWTLRLAASLTGNCRLRRPRPDRASCRTGMHLDRPPVASASISCPPADPGFTIRNPQAFRPDIAAATASRSAFR